MKKKYRNSKFCYCLLIYYIFIFMSAGISAGQEVAQVTINYIETNADTEHFGNRVRAYITVSSSDNESVLGLNKSNFKALEDGKNINIESVSQTDEPMSIVLTIDTSGSMQAQDKSGKTSMAAAKEAAVDFINLLGDDDRIALFSFNNDTNLHLDFTTDHKAAIEAINSLSSKYMAATRLYDTVMEAVKKASEIPKGRRAIIVLTDGKDEKGDGPCSIHSSSDVIDAATTKAIRVPIYTMGVGPKVDAKELGRMSGLTGGRSMLADHISELPEFYRKIADQLKNQIMVEYLTRAPSGEHSLVIKVSHIGNTEQDEKRFWSPPLPVIRPPKITILSPRPSETISGIVNVELNITPEEGLSKVRYYINSTLKGEKVSPPFNTFKWNTKDLSPGMYILRVEAVQINGQAGYAETTVKMEGEISRPKGTFAPEEELKRGISKIIWGLPILLLIIIFLIFIIKKKKGKTSEIVPTVTMVQPVNKRAETGKEYSKTPDMSANVDDEATTMDIKSILEPLAKLTVIKSQELDLGAIYKVKGTTEIGRGTGNDIIIPDKPVSRKHAIINYAGGKFHIRDLNSTYGTRVDGRDVTSGGVILNDGAKIQFGTKTVMEFNVLITGDETADDDDKTMIYGQ